MSLKDTELLRGLSLLEELDLSGCTELTDVSGLHQLKTLKSINLRNCPKLDSASVSALRAALPNTKIQSGK